MKKYKLKKDTPNLKAGSIFERNASSYHCKEHDFYYKTEYVENNPEWFEPIPERIELVFCENKVGTKKVYLGKKSFEVFKFTPQEKDLCEKAINGELLDIDSLDDLDFALWYNSNKVDVITDDSLSGNYLKGIKAVLKEYLKR